MALEEKRAWVMIVITIVGYAVYVSIILGRTGATPLVDVPYAAAMLWTIGGGIVAGILASIAVTIAGGHASDRKDERDRAIDRPASASGSRS
ncbi:hypothetical protein ACFQX7_35995 [Luedemannella flava]